MLIRMSRFQALYNLTLASLVEIDLPSVSRLMAHPVAEPRPLPETKEGIEKSPPLQF
jgi:hypothetical protein